MSERNPRFVATLDTTQLEAKAEEAQVAVTGMTRQMIGNIRRATELGLAMFQSFGGVIDQTYAIGIQAGLRMLELATTIRALQAATTVGASEVFMAFAQTAAIGLMLVTIANLEAGRNEAAAKWGAAYRAAQIATWRG